MLRPLYTRYRLVGSTFHLCRWRWVAADYPKAGRVTFPDLPGTEWDIVADYPRDARSPGALPPAPVLDVDVHRNGRRQMKLDTLQRLQDAFVQGWSITAASTYAGCTHTTARRHFTRMQALAAGQGVRS